VTNARLSAITTCKGRLEHLKVTLPTLIALPDCEVIVVDYDCPDGAGDWVAANHPVAKVVRVTDRPFFNIAEARNLGVAASSAPWLLLTDADVIVADGFRARVETLLQPGVFLRPATDAGDLFGTMIVARADLAEIGGYDEVFEGWGSEDLDVMTRLQMIERRLVFFPGELVKTIPHDNGLRGRFHEITDTHVNGIINILYRQAKMDLWRQGVRPNEAGLRQLYRQLREGARAPGGLVTAEVAFRQTNARGQILTTSFLYRLEPPR